MYHLLTGRLPFQAANNFSLIYQITNTRAEPPSMLRPGLPAQIDAIVMRAMAREREARYPRWEEFSRELAQVFRAERSVARKAQEFADSDRFETLRELAFFRDFSDAELWEVARISSWRHADAGQTLMKEGEPGENFCILAEGATSEVFLCQDPFRNREVAVKRIFPEALRDPTRGRLFRKLFFTEASLAGKLEHPHIAQIYDAGIGEDSGYIVMEYVPGGTMERFCVPENLLPLEQVVDIAFKCTRALAYAHMQGVTHRDIKPGNLLYAASPTDVRIGDFGLALNVGAETTQITGVGSPAYMSPEQIREELVDHRTDLYSLGVVMYQLLVGQLPFRANNKFSMIYQITQFDPPPPSALRRSVPTSLDRIVRRAMQKEAAKRYHSGDEFAEDLIEALRAGLGEARRESFGDADKFALLRSMRFFSAFVDQELWEVVKLGIWERVHAG